MELARCDDASAALCRATLPALGQVCLPAITRLLCPLQTILSGAARLGFRTW